MPPTIHIVRHAQGLHQCLSNGWAVPDPALSLEGDSQCRKLCKTFPHMDKITHLVASPMRRTILTCLQSFQPAVAGGKKILLVPEFQEVGAIPCTIGSSKKKLECEFGSKVDLSLVQEGWNDKSEQSPFNDYDRKKLAARAQKARQFLYDLSQSANDDAHIVVVTHGMFIDVLTKDYELLRDGHCWKNTEYRSFRCVQREKVVILSFCRPIPPEDIVLEEVMARPPKGKSFTQILKGLRFISPQGPEHTVEQPEGAVDYEAALEETDGSRNLRGVVLMQPNEYWRYKSSDDITTEG